MANKKKKQNNHASGSGSIISNYFESQDKLYERDMQGQKIASETRRLILIMVRIKSIRIPTIRISQNPAIVDWQRKQ